MQTTLTLQAPSLNPLFRLFGWLAGASLPGATHFTEPNWAQTQQLEQVQSLNRGETLCVEAPKGQAVWCSGGALWITHDGQPVDHIVEPGTYYIAKAHSRMLVHALEACTVHVVGR